MALNIEDLKYYKDTVKFPPHIQQLAAEVIEANHQQKQWKKIEDAKMEALIKAFMETEALEVEFMESLDNEVFKVHKTVFTKDYRFLEGYDDVVECLATGKIYTSHYKGDSVVLTETNHREAMEKIEKDMAALRDHLKR